MLLYVDKKKLKRRKIKIISITLSCILILLANIIHFNKTLHQTDKTLATYKDLQITQNWYNNADTATIFSEKKTKQIKAILIPKTINRENTLTIAFAFSKLLSSENNISFTNDVPEKEYLQKISNLFTQPTTENSLANTILVTTNIDNAAPLIKKEKLYPYTLNYKQAIQLQEMPSLQKLINEKFPLAPKPQSIQEQQQHSIKNFADKYHTDILSLIRTPQKTITFTTQNQILQNLGVCLSSQHKTICSTAPNKSLQLNIRTAIANLQNQKPQKLFLLTPLEEIPLNSPIDTDDGLFFRYGKQESFILPQINHFIPNNTNIYAYLKQQTGLNPDYHTPDMKFYKFKTTEININDNI